MSLQGSRLPNHVEAAILGTCLLAGYGAVALLVRLPWYAHSVLAIGLGAPLAAWLVESARRTVDRRCRDVLLDSMVDPLTQLGTSRLAEQTLRTEFAAAVRGRPLSVVLLRIDGFRRFATLHGREQANALLLSTARILRRHTRTMHLAAHHGREEATYMIVLSGIPLRGACVYTKRVRADIAGLTGFPAPIVVSAGVAEYEDGLKSPAILVKRAERALARGSAEGGRIIVVGRRTEPAES